MILIQMASESMQPNTMKQSRMTATPMTVVASGDGVLAATSAPDYPKIESGSTEAQASSRLSFEELFSIRRLQTTCKVIRKEVCLLRARDVVDWLDWFLTLGISLEHLQEQVISGQYNPSTPTRFEMGKQKGAFRTITSLNICDAVVYRHIADVALELAIPHKV